MFDLGIGTYLKVGMVAILAMVVAGAWIRYEYVVHEWHKLEQEKIGWQVEVRKWNSQKEQLETSLASINHEKKQAVTHEFEMFKETQKKLTTKQQKGKDDIKTVAKPTDVVIVPSWFSILYNDSVDSSRVASEGGGDSKVTRAYRPDLAGKTETFDAIAFTEVVKDNLDKYNSLALQCGTLIETVKKLEEIDENFNLGGPAGKITEIRGDLLDGVVGY